MKAKKELTHGELMATLFEHLNFPMSPPDLKKRIEHLIDRDFIERDPECATRYRYLAWFITFCCCYCQVHKKKLKSFPSKICVLHVKETSKNSQLTVTLSYI